MSFRFQKRVKLGKGLGLNFSKSGISTSYRTKYGTIGSRGFSIRTGIPGLQYRSSFGKSKKGDGIAIILILGLIIVSVLIIWNIFSFLYWLVKESFYYSKKLQTKRKIKNEIELNKNNEEVSFFHLSKESLPTKLQNEKIFLLDILIENKSWINRETNLALVKIGDSEATLSTANKGKVTFFKFPTERLQFNDCLCKIEKI